MPASSLPDAASPEAPPTAAFPGARVPYTDAMEFIRKPDALIPCYRFMGGPHDTLTEGQSEGMGEELAVQMYSAMARLHVMDQIMYEAQRQV